MIQFKENKANKNNNCPGKKVGYLKMKIINNLKSETINQKIESGVESNTDIVTDSYLSQKKISRAINHKEYKIDKTNPNKILPLVHKAISNANRF